MQSKKIILSLIAALAFTASPATASDVYSVDTFAIGTLINGQFKVDSKEKAEACYKILNDETEPITGTGTKDDPFSTYHIKNEGRSFQIPVHWHDELEIIYVKSGFLTVSISGENYIGTPGDAFVVSPGNLHFMGSQTGTVDY